MNVNFRLALGLVALLTLQACASTPRREITFLSTPGSFPSGDQVVIEHVFATSPNLKAGDLVVVQGCYRLQSRVDAVLTLRAASRQRSVQTRRRYEFSDGPLYENSPDYPAALFARKGQHHFELKYEVPNGGQLRVGLEEIYARNYLTPFSISGPMTLGAVTFKPVVL